MATTTTTHWEARPRPAEETRRLLELLFGPVADTSEEVRAA
ncbi:hypothetical protein Q9R08_04865 [Microbacterium sp. QXD-8]|uniref:Uncharacterized protein n=1 Tax=Microbacterium psychrotolerans TaxID=3068321 RepID=A0ABU0YY94_9MICO|nr:hypothetical protein [Microbacterium sp. QXD-8]MDQ7877303.1 hypothetical protein [Microbacterium sp. QXD-8]